jgi:putative hydrolase
VSGSGPLGDDPFQGIPFFGEFAKMFQSQGPVHWDAARQFALMVATEGQSPANIDPAVRFQWADLTRIAELHVQAATGLDTTVDGRAVDVLPVTEATWAQRSLEAYRPLFERLAGSLGATLPSSEELSAELAELGEQGDDMPALFAPLLQMLNPVLLGMAAGSMVGHLARRAFGQYDLPIPRPRSNELMVVTATVDRFGEDWSLGRDELRLWVCLHELTTHAVLAVPHVRQTLEGLLIDYVAGFQPNPRAIEEALGSVDPTALGDQAALQQALGDPTVLLGALESPAQRALQPRLDALVAVIIGYVDHTVDEVATGLVGSSGRIAEAVRRRRVETDASDAYVERLLGLSLGRDQVERGHAFAEGVLERAGQEGLSRLWGSAEVLPTPAEVDAPGLWLARIDLG